VHDPTCMQLSNSLMHDLYRKHTPVVNFLSVRGIIIIPTFEHTRCQVMQCYLPIPNTPVQETQAPVCKTPMLPLCFSLFWSGTRFGSLPQANSAHCRQKEQNAGGPSVYRTLLERNCTLPLTRVQHSIPRCSSSAGK